MKHLFLGGSKHGEMIDVSENLHVVIVPKPDAFRWDFEMSAPSLPAWEKREEEYVRQHQGLPSRLYDSVPVYLLRGANLADEFSLWLADKLNPEPTREDLLRDPNTPEDPEVVLETLPHLQVSVGGRTIRWVIAETEAVVAMQSFVQAMGPGKEIS